MGYFDDARDHMATINAISIEEANRLIASHFVLWEKRSAEAWIVDVAPGLLASYPDLSVLVGHRGEPLSEPPS